MIHRDENRSDTYQSDLTCARYIIVNNIDFPVNEDRTSWLNSMNKPVITKIEFTKEEQDIIKKIKKGEPMPRTKIITNKNGYEYQYTSNKKFIYEVGRKRLVELYSGLCPCGEYPAYRLSYDVGDEHQGAKLIERYCEPCFRKWENRRR